MSGEAFSKPQADKLGEALRHGEMSTELIERLSAYRGQMVHNAKDASEAIRSLTLYAVTPREGKSTESIVAKLRRQSIALSRMQDIVGCRAVVDTIIEQDALALRMSARFHDARLIDRRLQPTFGYRAVHFVLQWKDKPYEVQVRTRLQHVWAQVVERLSDRVHPDLKYGKAIGLMPLLVESLSKYIAAIEETEREVFSSRTEPDVHAATAQLNRVRSEVIDVLDQLDTKAKS